MIENIRLSFQGILSHKMRSFLTMLGIIIGIASLITIVSSITGINEQIKQNLIGSGNNLVRVQLYQDDWLYEPGFNGLPEGITPVSEESLDALKEIEHSSALSVYNRRTEYNSAIYYSDSELQNFEVYGIESDYFSTCGYAVSQGRSFTPKDFTNYQPVMIIDDSVADFLFAGENPIGQIVEYRAVAFVIVGVVKEASAFEPVINSIEDYNLYMQDFGSGSVFIPYTSWPDVFVFDEPEEVVLRADSTDDMAAVGKAASDILNGGRVNETIQYKADNVMKTAQQLQNLNSAGNTQMIWISFISLLVGGIGVMNIMLVSVTERTREIGLKKAIGARKNRILWQFLTESIVLTSLGGILGILSGIVFSKIFSAVTETPAIISLPSILLSVAFSMGIGILFGLLPSIKASNLNPIDALRHD